MADSKSTAAVFPLAITPVSADEIRLRGRSDLVLEWLLSMMHYNHVDKSWCIERWWYADPPASGEYRPTRDDKLAALVQQIDRDA
jgi:hypothetical protein